MNQRDIVLSAAAIGCVLLVLSAPWVWIGIFTHRFPTSTIALTVSLFCIASFAFTLVLGNCSPRALRILRFVLIFGVLSAIYFFIRQRVSLVPFSPMTKAVIAGLIMGSALLMGLRISDESWRRFQRMIIGASVAFAASFPLIWIVQQDTFSNSVFSLNFVEVANLHPRATAIIVLDEASPDLMGPVVKALGRERVTVRTRAVQAAGANTLNAMPAMLSGRKFDHPLPCGPGILCNEGDNLDFSALHSSRADVDVIGYYIPYCKIRGLRSCQEIPYWSDGRLFEAVYNLVCVHLLRHLQCETLVADIDARLLRGTLSAYLQSAEPNRGQWRSALRVQLDAAPFWRDGGVLFAHLPLPHLPARIPSDDLLLDYSENMVEAADLLSRFLDQMLRSFGDDFVLVVTSDHSLRVGNACREARYSSDHHCEQRMPPNLGLVPFVVVSPYSLRFDSVDSNLGLLR